MDGNYLQSIRRAAPAFALAFALAFGMTAPAAPAFAQGVGETRDVTKRGTAAAEFLSIPVSARATGMGNAFSASVDDASAIYWNPAGLTALQKGTFTAEYAQWLAGIDFSFAAVVLPTRFGTIGLGITTLQTPDMEVTTSEQQNGTGETFNAASYALSLSYGRALTDRFSIGGTAKFITDLLVSLQALKKRVG